jgi:hypothetical protein
METINPARPKWWGRSLTIQGAALSTVSAALPALGVILGVDINAMRELGSQTVTVVQAVGGLAGMAMTIAGRLRARSPLTTRAVTLQV